MRVSDVAVDEPTCWVMFPVYDIPQSAIEKLGPSELAAGFSECVTDAFQHARWGDASVLAHDPRLTISDETARLREALAELEAANDALCAVRSRAAYDQMIKDGNSDALIRLDEARRNARATLQSQEPK